MHKLLLGIAASTLMVTGALAHSAPAAPAPATPAPAYNSATFDWNGFYAGLGVSGAIFPFYNHEIVNVIGGINATSGKILFGLKGWVGLWTNTPTPVTGGHGAGIDARLGYLVTPAIVFYLSGGGIHLEAKGGATTYGTLGAGAEFALTDNVSFDVEYQHWMETGSTVVGNGLSTSLLWHL